MTTDTERQTIFITGGSSGIGAQLVKDSVRAGFDVGFTYFRETENADAVVATAREIAPEAKVQAWNLDVRNSEDVETVIDEALDVFEEIQTVVCNAGITRTGLVFTMSDEDWGDVIDTNLTGAFYVCRQFLPHFIGNRYGRFIHISSIAMHGMAGQASYCASKAGLAALSNALGKEYGGKGITSNTLALGLIDAGLTTSDASDRTVDFWTTYCPAGRMGDISEISGTVHYLASPAASFVNCETIHLAGGLNRVP